MLMEHCLRQSAAASRSNKAIRIRNRTWSRTTGTGPHGKYTYTYSRAKHRTAQHSADQYSEANEPEMLYIPYSDRGEPQSGMQPSN